MGGRIHFSQKKGEVGKIVKGEQFIIVANHCVYKFKKHYYSSYIQQ